VFTTPCYCTFHTAQVTHSGLTPIITPLFQTSEHEYPEIRSKIYIGKIPTEKVLSYEKVNFGQPLSLFSHPMQTGRPTPHPKCRIIIAQTPYTCKKGQLPC
jgi:hypothetical protein